jgi:hypothetical protein
MESKLRERNLKKDRGSHRLMWKESTLVSGAGIFSKILVIKRSGKPIAD